MKICKIEPLKLAQIPEIVALDQICLGGLWTEEGYRREFASPNSTILVLNLSHQLANQATKQQIMVGMACLWSIVDEAHITLLGIHPDYRQQGLGSLLLLSLLQDAIARKLKWATLEVNVNNLKAIQLYQKFGFVIAGKRKGYYQMTGEDASILWLKQLQAPKFSLNLSQWQQNIINNLSKNDYYWDHS